MTEAYELLKAGIADATDGASYFKAGREFQRNRDAAIVRGRKSKVFRDQVLEDAAVAIEEDKS